jgi:hypothetical protein
MDLEPIHTFNLCNRSGRTRRITHPSIGRPRVTRLDFPSLLPSHRTELCRRRPLVGRKAVEIAASRPPGSTSFLINLLANPPHPPPTQCRRRLLAGTAKMCRDPWPSLGQPCGGSVMPISLQGSHSLREISAGRRLIISSGQARRGDIDDST